MRADDLDLAREEQAVEALADLLEQHRDDPATLRRLANERFADRGPVWVSEALTALLGDLKVID